MFYFHSLSIPPLFFITSAYIIGILGYFYTSSAHMIALSGTLCIAGMIVWRRYWGFWRTIYAVYVLSMVAGYGNYWWHEHQYAQCRNLLMKGPIELYGTITDIAVTHKSRLPYCITMRINTSIRNNDVLALLHKKYITIYTRCIDKVCIDDELVIPHACVPSCTPTGMAYVRKEGIIASLFLEPHCYFVVAKPGSYRRWLFNQRKALEQRITHGMSSVTRAMYQLLFTGNKAIDAQDKKVLYDRCKKWGISHYLARSGLHMVLFIFLLELALQCINLPFIVKNIVLLSISSGYLLLTWPSISFLRAFWTYVVYKIYAIGTTPLLATQVLATICLATLLYNPYYLFSLDFQLSFTLSGVLIWMHGLTIARKKYSLKY